MRLVDRNTLALGAFVLLGIASATNAQTYVFDSAIGNGQLSGPAGLTVEKSGNLYVAIFYDSLIKEFNSSGGFVRNIGKGLDAPYGVALDSSGNLYVSEVYRAGVDEINNSGSIIQIIGSPGSGKSTCKETSHDPS